MRPEGGRVIITSRRTVGGHLVVVEDDGVGFDVNAPLYERRPHKGIEFCRTRLHEEVHGTLVIESEIGKGTRVEILIPFAR